MQTFRHLVTLKLKGILLDRIFNLLRDSGVSKVPKRTFSEVISGVRSLNLGWRFFVDTINKLHQNGNTNEHFFVKSLSIVQALI